jgi:hypothetical protein
VSAGSSLGVTLVTAAALDGASHVDLYDNERYVGPAAEKLTAFFTESLGKTA